MPVFPPPCWSVAEADAFHALGLDRRAALWAIRGLADTVLPLFAAADGQGRPNPELVEPSVTLKPMKEGREVVEDYRSVGLSLGQHPVAFLRAELRSRGMVTCEEVRLGRDGRRVVVPGIVLVRQKPGSAKGVMFITIEDESGVANLVLWADRFEKQRRVVLSAGMIASMGVCSARERWFISLRTTWKTCRTCCAAWGTARSHLPFGMDVGMERRTRRRGIRGMDPALDQVGDRLETSTCRTCGWARASRCQPGTSGNGAEAVGLIFAQGPEIKRPALF